MTSAGEYLQEAEDCYREMLKVQVAIDQYENEALRLAGGDRIAAAKVYLARKDSDPAWLYNNLVSNRDMWMKRAKLAATMALARGVGKA